MRFGPGDAPRPRRRRCEDEPRGRSTVADQAPPSGCWSRRRATHDANGATVTGRPGRTAGRRRVADDRRRPAPGGRPRSPQPRHPAARRAGAGGGDRGRGRRRRPRRPGRRAARPPSGPPSSGDAGHARDARRRGGLVHLVLRRRHRGGRRVRRPLRRDPEPVDPRGRGHDCDRRTRREVAGDPPRPGGAEPEGPGAGRPRASTGRRSRRGERVGGRGWRTSSQAPSGRRRSWRSTGATSPSSTASVGDHGEDAAPVLHLRRPGLALRLGIHGPGRPRGRGPVQPVPERRDRRRLVRHRGRRQGAGAVPGAPRPARLASWASTSATT